MSPYIIMCYLSFFIIDLKTSTPSSVLKNAAHADQGFSSNGTVSNFLSLLAQ